MSYIIAFEAAKQLAGINLLIVTPDRVRVHSDSCVKVLEYNPVIVAAVLILAVLSRRLEIVLPHAKGGRLTGWFVKFSRNSPYNLSYIDDGMDTFRDTPKNIELDFVRDGSKYYSFDYANPVAKWLDTFEVVPVCSIATIADDVKPALNLKKFDCLIIASPGVDLNADFSKFGEAFYITHPNYFKKQSISIDHNVESGLNCSVEKTIIGFNGKVVVGESMVLVFAMLCVSDTSRIHVYLNVDQYHNLSSLHPLLCKCGSVFVGGKVI